MAGARQRLGRGAGAAARAAASRSCPALAPPLLPSRWQIQADLAAAGDKGGPAYKLRLLIEQGKDVEQAGACPAAAWAWQRHGPGMDGHGTGQAQAARHPSFMPRPAVLGCLKDALFELHEGVAWGLLEPEFERQQRQQVRHAGGRGSPAWVRLPVRHGVAAGYARSCPPAGRACAALDRLPYACGVA